jgi:hypothetical protein
MIIGLRLTEQGKQKIETFLDDYAKPTLKRDRLIFDIHDKIIECAENGESLTYELRAQYSVTDRPEILKLYDPQDILLTFRSGR